MEAFSWEMSHVGLWARLGYGMGHGLRFHLLACDLSAGVVWFVRSQSLAGGQRRSTSLEVLEERYARGEINHEEYLQKKRDILG